MGIHNRGRQVSALQQGGQAELSGIVEGDKIYSVNGEVVRKHSGQEIFDKMQNLKNGQEPFKVEFEARFYPGRYDSLNERYGEEEEDVSEGNHGDRKSFVQARGGKSRVQARGGKSRVQARGGKSRVQARGGKSRVQARGGKSRGAVMKPDRGETAPVESVEIAVPRDEEEDGEERAEWIEQAADLIEANSDLSDTWMDGKFEDVAAKLWEMADEYVLEGQPGNFVMWRKEKDKLQGTSYPSDMYKWIGRMGFAEDGGFWLE